MVMKWLRDSLVFSYSHSNQLKSQRRVSFHVTFNSFSPFVLYVSPWKDLLIIPLLLLDPPLCSAAFMQIETSLSHVYFTVVTLCSLPF